MRRLASLGNGGRAGCGGGAGRAGESGKGAVCVGSVGDGLCLNAASVALCLEMGMDIAKDAGWIVGRIERMGTFVLRVRSFPVQRASFAVIHHRCLPKKHVFSHSVFKQRASGP